MTRFRLVLAYATSIVAFALTAPLLPLAAQTIVGSAIDESDGRPVSGAAVRLLDAADEVVAETLADELGRFTLTPPSPGDFRLVAERIGYRFARTPLISLGTSGRVTLELAMMPAPIGLEGLDVEVEVATQAAEQLRLSGVEPRDLGNRWITRTDIEAIAVRRDFATLLEWQQIAGLQVLRSENYNPIGEDLGLCVSLQRARTGSGAGRCALVVLDGHPLTSFAAQDLDPESVEAMALLQPSEATIMYGTLGGAGALMIWTRHGRR